MGILDIGSLYCQELAIQRYEAACNPTIMQKEKHGTK